MCTTFSFLLSHSLLIVSSFLFLLVSPLSFEVLKLRCLRPLSFLLVTSHIERLSTLSHSLFLASLLHKQ